MKKFDMLFFILLCVYLIAKKVLHNYISITTLSSVFLALLAILFVMRILKKRKKSKEC